MNLIRAFWTDDAGQDMAEYALLLALIALVIVVAIMGFREAIQARFQGATSTLTKAGTPNSGS